MRESGQSKFYEPSDWAGAEYVAMAMTRAIEARRFSAASFRQVWGAMTDLLTTEGARRRARIEVEREKREEWKPEGVTRIEELRLRATGGDAPGETSAGNAR